jgi:hypothetical protein
MTNEEALRLIKATEYCFVVWSTAENEVVAVKSLRKDSSFDERHDALATLSNECSGPTRGRFLDPTSVSMNTLREEQAEIALAAERVRMLWSWRSCGTEDLLLVLETGVFPPPMDTRDDAGLLIDEIYYARAAGLCSQQLAWLDAVAAQAFFSPLGSTAAYKLECGLAVIQKDRKRLERFWRLRLAEKRPRIFSADFAVAAGDLALDLDDVVDHFVASGVYVALSIISIDVAVNSAVGVGEFVKSGHFTFWGLYTQVPVGVFMWTTAPMLWRSDGRDLALDTHEA